MSNSIWKTPDQEQKYNEEVLIEYMGVSGRPFYEFDDFVRRLPNLKRWCYITDIVAQADKAERLQKAVDCALEELQRVAEDEDIDWLRAESARTTIDEIKQQIKENQ